MRFLSQILTGGIICIVGAALMDKCFFAEGFIIFCIGLFIVSKSR